METTMSSGLAIAVLGMAIVFCFIALLALAIHMLARFKGEQTRPIAAASDELVAVIGAALHAHRFISGSAERRGKP
jgi:Na+-transporting methylmalonyl-CoA/oxaloacetate decarboxylase gamma subunit